MGLKFSNFGKAIVASAPAGVSGLNFTVEAGKGLLYPALGAGDYFYGILKDAAGNREVVKVESRSGDSMQIAVGGRGLDGTDARTWSAGDYFVAGITNVALQESLSNANLISLGAQPTAADLLAYFTAPGIAALTAFTAFARTLLDDADAAAMRATLNAAQDFQPGTSMLFYNAVAPVGWTQDTAALDHALRVVGGAGGSAGGSVDFTAAFKSQPVTGSNSAVTLSKAQIPPHNHSYSIGGYVGAPTRVASSADAQTGLGWTSDGIDNGIGGGSHNHAFTGTPIDLSVKYLNMIRATRNG